MHTKSTTKRQKYNAHKAQYNRDEYFHTNVYIPKSAEETIKETAKQYELTVAGLYKLALLKFLHADSFDQL